MSGISSKAVLKTLSAYKYNAGSEFEDEGGLNYYNTFYRKYDAQIGRFTGVDMLAESFAGVSPFQFGNNNPVFFNDPTGAKYQYVDKHTDVRPSTPWPQPFSRMRMQSDGWFDNVGGPGGSSSSSAGTNYISFWSSLWNSVSENGTGEFGNFRSKSGTNKNGESGSWVNYSFSLSDGVDGDFGNVTTLNTVVFGATFVKDQENLNIDGGLSFIGMDSKIDMYNTTTTITNNYSTNRISGIGGLFEVTNYAGYIQRETPRTAIISTNTNIVNGIPDGAQLPF